MLNRNAYMQKCMHKNVHSGTNHSIDKVETTHMPTGGGMDKLWFIHQMEYLIKIALNKCSYMKWYGWISQKMLS
jgi:hypothetical protein